MDPVTLALIGGAALLFVAKRRRSAPTPNLSGTVDSSGSLQQGGAGASFGVQVTPGSSTLGEPASRAPLGSLMLPAMFAGGAPTASRSTALAPSEARKRAKRVRKGLQAVRSWILKQRAKTPGRHWRKEVRREIAGRLAGDLEPVMATGAVPSDAEVEAVVRAAMARAPQPWGTEHMAEALDVLWSRFSKGLK